MPIKLDIVTIERVVFSEEVDMVVAPGTEGMLGILPHHAPLMTALNAGELVIKSRGRPDQLIAIGGGFMEVRPDKVTILADSAEHADEIDIARAEEARKRAETSLKEKPADAAQAAIIEAALRRASVRIKVARRHRTRAD
ncbi:MAG: F0F1 ATP synthase subunit epsilon [Chloroflexi bacterium]|nr:F0F1 ATP synthase subunit epsilon [Chloroflexota bacterium]